MIGGEKPEVFGDLYMADMDEMYMSKPFTANKRPSSRYGQVGLSIPGQNMLLILGGMDSQYCTMEPYVLTELEKNDQLEWEK